MWIQRRSDVEAGAYPIILDDARHRWIFIRKVYFIIAIQLLVTAAVAATVILVHPIADFIVHTKVGLAVYIVIIVIPFIGTFKITSFMPPCAVFAL